MGKIGDKGKIKYGHFGEGRKIFLK